MTKTKVALVKSGNNRPMFQKCKVIVKKVKDKTVRDEPQKKRGDK